MNKRVRRFLQTVRNHPSDILIASHPYGLLVVPHSNRFSLREAIMEIRKCTTKTIACDPPLAMSGFVDLDANPEIVVQWGVDADRWRKEVPEGAVVVRHISPQELLKDPDALLFSGHLTSPWTLFRVPVYMAAVNAPPARRSLMEMANNVCALHKVDPQVIRQRLRAVETSVKTWFTKPVPKRPSGFRLCLFPVEEGVDRTQTLLGPDSVHVMTRPNEADLITLLIVQKCRNGISEKDLCITDATANVGGNTISFSRTFGKVQSVEVDPVNFQALCNNVSLYKRSNVQCIMGDYVEVSRQLVQDIVFIDPPWGGSGYRMHRHLSLELSRTPVPELVSRLSGKCGSVVLKVPLNFDMAIFINSTWISSMLHNGMARIEALTMRSFLVIFVFFMEPVGPS